MGPRIWRSYLVVGLLAAGAYLILPESALKDAVAFDLFGASAVAAICIGVRRNHPGRTLPWALLAAGQALFVQALLAAERRRAAA